MNTFTGMKFILHKKCQKYALANDEKYFNIYSKLRSDLNELEENYIEMLNFIKTVASPRTQSRMNAIRILENIGELKEE